MNEAYAVDVANVVKSFGALKALDGVTLRVRQGEIYGLLGPNGAGKTTLIRAIVGLVAPDSGTVTVLGQAMPNLDILGSVGYMTQAAALYPDLSVEENLRFFAAISGADSNVDEVLKLVEHDHRVKPCDGRSRTLSAPWTHEVRETARGRISERGARGCGDEQP